MDGSGPYDIEVSTWLEGFLAGVGLLMDTLIRKMLNPAWNAKSRRNFFRQIFLWRHPVIITFSPEYIIKEPLSLNDIPGWTFLEGKIRNGQGLLVGEYELSDRLLFAWVKEALPTQ